VDEQGHCVFNYQERGTTDTNSNKLRITKKYNY